MPLYAATCFLPRPTTHCYFPLALSLKERPISHPIPARLAQVGAATQAALRDASKALQLRLEAAAQLAQGLHANSAEREAGVERQALQRKLDEALAALCEKEQALAESRPDAVELEQREGRDEARALTPFELPAVIRVASVADAWPTGAW